MNARLGNVPVDGDAWPAAGLAAPDFVPTGRTDIDFTDIFAGAGGSSIGLVGAGLNLKLAANHSRRAIETHATNFTHAEHLIADVTNYDMRKLPRTQVLWAPPSCVWHSPAGGHKREEQIHAELDATFDDYVPNEAAERSRTTAFDVIRAVEVHRYKVVIVENVIEFATKWQLFDWWVAGLQNLGYTVQLISVSSAHIGDATNTPAAQWRDRLSVCTAPGVPIPDVSPRPTAWCGACDEVVAAVQSWRRPNQRNVGKYRQQYDYRCPNARCRYSLVEPFVLPAASIIDWTDLGSRIGDREANGKRPLVAATMRRIQSGLDMFAEPTMRNVNDGIGEDGRPYPAAASPVPARTTKTGDGLACPPMLVPAGGRWIEIASSLKNPTRTRTTRDIEGVCTPDALPESFITMLRNHAEATGISEPLATLATARHSRRHRPTPRRSGGRVHLQAPRRARLRRDRAHEQDRRRPAAQPGHQAEHEPGHPLPQGPRHHHRGPDPYPGHHRIRRAGHACDRHQRLPLPDGQASRVRASATLPGQLPTHRQPGRAAAAGRYRGQQQRQPVARRDHRAGAVMTVDRVIRQTS